MLAVDAFLITKVFQPIVDRLTWWRTHNGLAVFCLCGAILCAAIRALISLTYFDFIMAVAPLPMILVWTKEAYQYDRLDKQAARGDVPRPNIGSAFQRIIYVVMTISFVVLEVAGGLWDLSQAVFDASFILALSGHYFAGCQPGTPKQKSVFSCAI
jgi:hypothetical protein